MQLFVMLPGVTGASVLIVAPEDTVGSLKRRVAALAGLDEADFRLKSGACSSLGRDQARLGAKGYGLGPGSTVECLLRLRGGGRKVAYFYDGATTGLASLSHLRARGTHESVVAPSYSPRITTLSPYAHTPTSLRKSPLVYSRCSLIARIFFPSSQTTLNILEDPEHLRCARPSPARRGGSRGGRSVVLALPFSNRRHGTLLLRAGAPDEAAPTQACPPLDFNLRYRAAARDAAKP
jgi:hypothetical protein